MIAVLFNMKEYVQKELILSTDCAGREAVCKTLHDILQLPKVDDYVNSVKRVPNSLSKVMDQKDDQQHQFG